MCVCACVRACVRVCARACLGCKIRRQRVNVRLTAGMPVDIAQ